MTDSVPGPDTLDVGNQQFTIYPIAGLEGAERLPYCLKILLENAVRQSHFGNAGPDDIKAITGWEPTREPDAEIAFTPARVLLQDFTGVPAIVDLAAMRDAMVQLGGDPHRINPLNPVELVIDHSVMVDHFGTSDALAQNTGIEVARNRERYQFLRWGQSAFANFKVVPPGRGIVHQVNLEHLARGVFTREQDGQWFAYPDTLVGTDSHTTMINGLGVLGWGVGGIEAEAAMLGQAISMLLPQVVGVRLHGALPPGVTATDLVLTVTERLRAHGVVGKFVEFFGAGLASLTLADRATIANMAPEYGATCGIFPTDQQTVDYLRFTGRDDDQLNLVEAYMKAMGLWFNPDVEATYSATLDIDLGAVEASLAGPRRPQDRVPLSSASASFEASLEEHQAVARVPVRQDPDFEDEGGSADPGETGAVAVTTDGNDFQLEHGAVVIAAITSCTNTSNPALLITAGLMARNARRAGLTRKPWVKTSLAPGSRVVTRYLEQSGLLADLEAIGFYVVGYGCTTCIGNSGPLDDNISAAIQRGRLMVASVLSGNRNFEGRIHQDVRANYLASPPLVVAYALAGNMNADLTRDALGTDANDKAVTMADLWPAPEEVQAVLQDSLAPAMFVESYADVFTGTDDWDSLTVSGGDIYEWPESDYVRKPPFFAGLAQAPEPVTGADSARCLVKVGDSVTTDHISPAGAIATDSPAGSYLQERGIAPQDFNSYGSRRGNHEVMMRGTFANVRLQNQLVPGSEGSWTRYFPTGEDMSIFAAAERYQEDGTPLVVLAGKEYGTGSSRDWAAKGPALLGISAVIAESYERIHRSNLVGMGILPLQYPDGTTATSLGLDGSESFSWAAPSPGARHLAVTASRNGKVVATFDAVVRIDTPNEYDYYRNGGILSAVLRRLAAG